MKNNPELVVGRVLAAGLVAWMAWIHLHLWSDGYKHIHIIGVLFLLNFIGGVAVALSLLAAPRKLLGLVAGGGFLMVAGALVSLAISINFGLFGFKDSFNAPFVHLALAVEIVALVVLSAIAARSIFVGGRTLTGPAVS